ncbi:hypothetical protein ACFL96_08420 [Thermoproteota archaeon]
MKKKIKYIIDIIVLVIVICLIVWVLKMGTYNRAEGGIDNNNCVQYNERCTCVGVVQIQKSFPEKYTCIGFEYCRDIDVKECG